jgi:hypothetical protein
MDDYHCLQVTNICVERSHSGREANHKNTTNRTSRVCLASLHRVIISIMVAVTQLVYLYVFSIASVGLAIDNELEV